jgi:membrane protein implicated in regulation of membrane protease activity
MSDDSNRIHEALGKLTANVDNLTKAFESHKEETTVEHRKVHDIVVAMSEAVRNLTRRIELVEPVAKEFQEGQIEQRGIKRFLVLIWTTAGGLIVVALGKIWDWYMARPHIPAIIIALLALAALTTAALAQTNHAQHHPTYKNWVNKDGASCCNDQDCGELASEDEREKADGTIEVKVEGEWCPVYAKHYLKAGNAPNWSTSHVCVLRKILNPGMDACKRFICYQPKPGT